MLRPGQFRVNEAWIAFKLNDAPISAGDDGDFNFIALMDAASGVILSSVLVPATEIEPSTSVASRLLRDAYIRGQQLPQKIFIPSAQPATNVTSEAERQGVTVVRVTEEQLLPFVSDAREAFLDSFSVGRLQ